jgi:hypothetical protein
MKRTAAERERLKIVAYVQRRAAEGERVLKRDGRLRAEEADYFRRRVSALADEIERGFHL